MNQALVSEKALLAWNQLKKSQAAGRAFFAQYGLSLNWMPEDSQNSEIYANPELWWKHGNWEEVHDAFGSLEQFFLRLEEWEESRIAPASILEQIQSLELVGGTDKTGRPEGINLVFKPGEVICLVGPTGAGKSRLLADIECLAQEDTPSRRKILLNGKVPDEKTRFSVEHKLIAQISQNMNFVMDLEVQDFLQLHAESRGLADSSDLAAQVLDQAIELAGEAFTAKTPLTQLSGGQSRALMIADAAYLSPKPLVLIDEIENAGVDRKRALSLFTQQGKLVFLSTHDPLLALSGDRRLVIRQGGIHAVLETSPEEKALLGERAKADAALSKMREGLRRGERLL